MLNCSASLAMSTCVLKALPGKLDIKRHSPSILYVSILHPKLLMYLPPSRSQSCVPAFCCCVLFDVFFIVLWCGEGGCIITLRFIDLIYCEMKREKTRFSYGKTCAKRPLKTRQNNDLTDKWWHNEGQMYCRMQVKSIAECSP